MDYMESSVRNIKIGIYPYIELIPKLKRQGEFTYKQYKFEWLCFYILIFIKL